MSLAGLLDDGPDADRLVHVGDRSWSRGEVRARADALAAALGRAGVDPGAVVAVSLPNGVDAVAALFGVWRAGAVHLPLNPRLTARERERAIAATRPSAIVVDGQAPVDSSTAGLIVARIRADGTVDATGGPPAGAAHHDADIALVQFTSGTTGAPKAVLLRHTGVLRLLDGVVAKLRGGSASRASAPPMPNLIPVSLSLWAGLYNVLFALRVGASVVVLERFEPRTFAAEVRRHDIRSTVLPPAAMVMLVDDPVVASLEPLRFVRSITAPLSPLQARRFVERFGVGVLNSYGQTEIGGEIVGWTAADHRAFGDTKLGSVGRPHDDVELRVVDDAGQRVPVGGEGELQVRTPAMSAGYADGGGFDERLTPDGWFRTGDVGRVDAEGFLWIEGRLSDMINRGGLKVHPGEVEEVLRLDPAVAEAVVAADADERLGEVPVAFVVARSGATIDVERLADRCRAMLAPYKVPVAFEVVNAVPRNEVGKVLRRQLVATRGGSGR